MTMMMLSKHDMKPFLIFLITVAIVRHIQMISIDMMDKKSVADYFKNLDKQNYISASDVIAALLYVVLIRKCCGSNLVKNGITAFLMFYLFTSYQISAASSMESLPSFSSVFNMTDQKDILKLTVAPTIAAMIVCRCC